MSIYCAFSCPTPPLLKHFAMTGFLVSTPPVHLARAFPFIGHHGSLSRCLSQTFYTLTLTHTLKLWGILGIRGRLHCRRHINKMFYFPPSAVCVKTAPALPCSCTPLHPPPLHRRLPHFSLLLLTFSFAWRYKGCGNKAGLHHRSIKDERSERGKPESVFSFLVFFPSLFSVLCE